MSKKIVYIITTYKCSACKCIEHILRTVQDEFPTNVEGYFDIETYDFKEVPEWLTINVPMHDFPTVIFTDNDVIKFHFTGTMPRGKLLKVVEDVYL